MCAALGSSVFKFGWSKPPEVAEGEKARRGRNVAEGEKARRGKRIRRIPEEEACPVAHRSSHRRRTALRRCAAYVMGSQRGSVFQKIANVEEKIHQTPKKMLNVKYLSVLSHARKSRNHTELFNLGHFRQWKSRLSRNLYVPFYSPRMPPTAAHTRDMLAAITSLTPF